MATEDHDDVDEARKPTPDHLAAQPVVPRPKPSKAETDRRERVAAFWIIGFIVFAPFLLIAWFIWDHFFGGGIS